jgi:hypothetical protein
MLPGAHLPIDFRVLTFASMPVADRHSLGWRQPYAQRE